MNRLEKKKAKKPSYTKNKESVLKSTKILYKGVNIIIDAFKDNVFAYILLQNFTLQKEHQEICLISNAKNLLNKEETKENKN